MRNPERLDEFYAHLLEVHKKEFPDWRFGQLMSNFQSWYQRDIFFLEEENFLSLFDRFTKAMKGD